MTTRRAAGLGGLLAGIGLIVALKSVSGGPAASTHLALPPETSTRATPTPTHSAAHAATHPAGPVTVTGSVVDTVYGPVQVRVTIAGGRVTDVQTLQTPGDATRSVRLAQYAVPILRQEVLAAQSAQIDTVSGATYTSQGYAQSVQSALDHAPS
jgi:uncharacterized protein with FMN-binding domain